MKDLRSRHEPPSPRILDVLSILAIIGAVLVSFFPVLSGNFLNHGDDSLLLQDNSWRGIAPRHLKWMFTTWQDERYQPLTWLTFGIDSRIWKDDARGYHLTSVLLHMLAAILCFRFARRLFRLGTGSTARDCLTLSAAMTALLFAVHPLRVESVGWIAQRQDVLGGVFFFGCLLAYIRAYEFWAAWFMAGHDPNRPTHPSWGWLFLSYVLFLCCLMSNITVLGLPLILLALDICPLHRLGGWSGWFNRRTLWVWIEKAIFALPAVTLGFLTLQAHSLAGNLQSCQEQGMLMRTGQALYGLVFYLWKTLLPLNLGPLYVINSESTFVGIQFWLRLALLVGITLYFWSLRKRFPALLAAWVCYIVLLAPVLGFIQGGQPVVADRYTYFACIAWALMAGRGSLSLLRRFYRGEISRYTGLMGIVSGLLLAILFTRISHHQSRFWVDSQALWKRGVAINPDSAIAHLKLADALAFHGDSTDAMASYRTALDLAPTNAEAWNGLGVTLVHLDETDKAVDAFKKAIDHNPTNPTFRANLAGVLASKGNLQQAAEQYSIALLQAPETGSVRILYANVLCDLGQWMEASTVYQLGLQLNRKDPDLAIACAWLLATCPDDRVRDGVKAKLIMDRVMEARGRQNPGVLMVLAATQAECGLWTEALVAINDAIFLAHTAQNTDLTARLERQQNAYRNRKPWRYHQ